MREGCELLDRNAAVLRKIDEIKNPSWWRKMKFWFKTLMRKFR